MEEARQHLDRFINEPELSDCVLLVLANKQVIKLLSLLRSWYYSLIHNFCDKRISQIVCQ